MFPSYVTENFWKGLFERLKDMVKIMFLSYFRQNGRNYDTIYLPFNNHYFVMFMLVKSKIFLIENLVESEINTINITLYYASENI